MCYLKTSVKQYWSPNWQRTHFIQWHAHKKKICPLFFYRTHLIIIVWAHMCYMILMSMILFMTDSIIILSYHVESWLVIIADINFVVCHCDIHLIIMQTKKELDIILLIIICLTFNIMYCFSYAHSLIFFFFLSYNDAF